MAARFPITALIGAKVDGLVKNTKAAFSQLRREARGTGGAVDDALEGKTRKGRSRSAPRLATVGRAARSTAAALGGGLVASAAVAAKRVFAFEQKLDAIAVQSGKTEPQVDALRQQINATSRATGLSREEVATAVDQLVNLEGGSAATAANIDLMGRAVTASGAAGDDLAGVMFALNKSFFGGTASAEEMEAALSAVLTAGKQGSIPLSEMSVVLQQVAAKFKDVSAGGVQGATDLAAAMQAVRPAFGSAAEAGTGLRAAVGALTGKSKELSNFGVEVFNIGKDGSRELKPLREIMDQIANSDLAKRPDLLQKALGSSEALAFVNALLAAEGRKAWDELAESAEGSAAVQEDFLKRTRSQAGRIQTQMNNLNVTLDEAFTPERIEAFTVALSAAITAAATAVDLFVRLGVAIGEAAASIGVGDVDAAIERHQRENQLLKEQVLQLGKRNELAPQLLESIRRRGETDEGVVAASAGQQIVAMAEQEGFIKDGTIDKGRITEEQGLGAHAFIKGLERAMALAAEVDDRRAAAGFQTLGQLPEAPDTPSVAPMLQSLAQSQRELAHTQARMADAAQDLAASNRLAKAGVR